MSECDCHISIQNEAQRRVLWILLLINGLMFLLELFLGIYSQSTALIADSMDMLADASVYGLGLYVVGKTAQAKARAAGLSGVLEIGLGVMVLVDITRRFIHGSEPESLFMIFVGMLALLANVSCLMLLSKHRDGEVHMRASWIFSKNDVIANLGVILAGLMVYVLNSRLPDLIIGSLVAFIVIKGGLAILKDAGKTFRNESK